MPRIALIAAAVLSVAPLVPPAEAVSYCPRVLHRATRLLIITVPDMGTSRAQLRTFERASPAERWKPHSGAEAAVLGARGLAWGQPYASYARGKEPIKTEGDRRTPAGIYRLGSTFGFAKDARPGHLQLTPGAQFCVDDAGSPLYGRIVKRSAAGEKTSGEDMAASPLHKRGIVVDYPPRRRTKGGSCIFLHVWGGEESGTAGCVALPEERIAYLQDWAASRHTVIAILEQDAIARFNGCLPAPPGVARYEPPASLPQPDPRRRAAR